MTTAETQQNRSIATPPAVRLAAGTTTIEFVRDGDRWRHEIRTSDGGIWKSLEGVARDDDDPRWPRSPVLTEVSVQEIAGRPAVLGMGHAGRSHFSLCVTAASDGEDTLLLEAACRINAEAGWLGSTYADRVGRADQFEPANANPAPPATICWSYSCGPDGLRPLPSAIRRAAGG